MVLVSILLIVLSIIITFILLYLATSLIRWSIAFEKWKKSSNHSSNESDQEFDDFAIHSSFEMNTDTKLENITSTFSSKQVDLSTILTSDHILIFLDKTCVFCNSNFEEFIDLIEENKNYNKSFSIIFNKSQVEAAKSFLFLHEYNFQVYLTEDDALKESFKKSFLPMYVQTEYKQVKNISSSPFEMFN